MKTVSMIEYLTLAFAAKLFYLRSWRIRMLMRIHVYKDSPELYLHKVDGHYVFMHNGELCRLEADPEKSPLKWDTVLKVPKGFLPNIEKQIETTFGRLLLNIFGFTEEFGDLVPYVNQEMNPGTFNKIYYGLYREGKIERTSQLLNSIKYLHILEADAEFGVPAASIETFTTHPDMERVVKEQLELHKDDLDNPATQAKIDAVTTTLDREYVKGTQAEKFLISGKMHDVVRKKTMIMYGSETGMDGKPTPLIGRPLSKGIDLEMMPSWVDVGRNGAHSRGGLTALSGYSVKTDDLAYGHLEVSDIEDCKTKRFLTVTIRDYNKHMFVGMRMGGTNEPITTAYVNSNLDKTIDIRAPSHCILERDYCKYCMGLDTAERKQGIPSGVMILDSNSMDAQMQASHSKAVKVNRLTVAGSMT